MTDSIQAIVAEMRNLSNSHLGATITDWADRLESLAPASGGAIKARVSQIEDAIAVGSMTSAQVFMIGLMLMMNGSLDSSHEARRFIEGFN